MQQKITPFLWFDKDAQEAINWYISIFQNNPSKRQESRVVSIQYYPDGPLEGPMRGFEGKVLTAVFELNGQRFMALDGGPFFKATGAVSFYVECQDQAEVDYFWEALTQGGNPKVQQCGWLQDKFGFSWQIIPAKMPELLGSSDKARSGKAMQAMLQMKKIDIAALQDAFDS